MKQWVQTPINKNRLPPGGFLLGSQVLFFILISKVFIGISGKSFKPVFGHMLHSYFNKEFNHI